MAEGQGLPMDIVEKEARQTQQILDLYMLKVWYSFYYSFTEENFCSNQLD
jgi:hypothetical protein